MTAASTPDLYLVEKLKTKDRHQQDTEVAVAAPVQRFQSTSFLQEDSVAFYKFIEEKFPAQNGVWGPQVWVQ